MNWKLFFFTLLIITVGVVVIYLVSDLAAQALVPQAHAQTKHKPAPKKDDADEVEEMFNDGTLQFGVSTKGEYVLRCLNSGDPTGKSPEDSTLIISCGK